VAGAGKKVTWRLKGRARPGRPHFGRKDKDDKKKQMLISEGKS
jgi:hypothetical protein